MTKKATNWWEGSKEPLESSSIRLAWGDPERGGQGDYFILHIGKEDGARLRRDGIEFLSLEGMKKRTVKLVAHRGVENGRRGLHKIRTPAMSRPQVHFPVDDGKYKTVEAKWDQNEIELTFDGDEITFELPPSLK
jgi:hypothetical protein